MLYALKLLGCLLALLAVVPIVGFCVTGSVKLAWRYTKDWATAIGLMIAVSAVLFVIIWLAIPNPY